MKILITSIGTRGDMEPFLAIAELLLNKGHEVTCVFPGQFENLVNETGAHFETLGDDFIRMLDSPAGRSLMGGGTTFFQKIRAYLALAKHFSIREINREMIRLQRDIIDKTEPDLVIHNGKTIYPIIWEKTHPGKRVLVSPVPYIYHPVKERVHIAFSGNYGRIINGFTYSLANFGLIQTVVNSAKQLGLPFKVKNREIRQALLGGKVIYTLSPTLFSRPAYWPETAQVLGYHERNKASHWKPDEALNTFLQLHPKILLVTFGSMTNPDPEKKSDEVIQTLQKLKIPAIVNAAAGGLIMPDGFQSDHIIFVSQIPYDWIFPKVYAVIHHGGSGTTHMALKNGCATMIIPHIIDQFMWNGLVSDMGAGPKGVAITQFTTERIEPLLKDLFENPLYKQKAIEIAERMKKEDFREALYAALIGGGKAGGD